MSGRIVFVSDLLSSIPDMGERVYARDLARALSAQGVTVISVDGVSEDADASMNAGRSMFSARLARALRAASPRGVLLLQRSSLTVGGVIRAAVIRLLAGAPVVPLVLQPYPLSPLARVLLRPIAPPRILVVSQGHADSLRREFPRAEVVVVQAAVDGARFRPPSPGERAAIRNGLRLPAEAKVVLHVGHLKKSRNLGVLTRLASNPGYSVVMVSSSSTRVDEQLRDELLSASVRIVSGYVKAVEEWYRAADVYVFPTRDEGGSIAVPISVLEALSCGVPVACTRFGALPALLDGVEHVRFVEDDAEFAEAVSALLVKGISAAPLYSAMWSDVADMILASMPEARR